jgi:Raf kinase inhibitor-like YbhB/YbcL family protein
MVLTSPDFPAGGPIPQIHAAARLGGQELSPALTWSPVPPGTAELLLVIEDPDAPMATPYIHGLALIEASRTALDRGALSEQAPGHGVRVLRSTSGRGWVGMAPPKGHGAHRYVFQLFALPAPLTIGSRNAAAEAAPPRKVLAAAEAAGPVLARARLDGVFQRA